MKSSDYEQQRLAIQCSIDSSKSLRHRSQMGQFSTPSELACSILEYAHSLIDQSQDIRFLEPGFGTGTFYSALMQKFDRSRIVQATGFEIDNDYAQPAQVIWKNTGLELFCTDFTQATQPDDDNKRANLIICNPPYVRHQRLSHMEKQRLRHKAQDACGLSVSGLCDLYCYFLLIAHNWLAQEGVAGWLIPSGFMDVNYGDAIKKYLLNEVTLLHIHRFNQNGFQFRDAMVSSTVVWFRKRKPSDEDYVVFTYDGTLQEPEFLRRVSIKELKTKKKWTQLYTTSSRSDDSRYTLASFFSIKRGLATGNNDFFILPKSKIEELNLPWEFFRPILPSPKYLKVDEVKVDKKGMPDIPNPLFLLDCDLKEEVIKNDFPKLWDYLLIGYKKHVCDAYLCRKRRPWYSQEKRPPSLFLCGYIGRSVKKRNTPFRFILNHSCATATNSYLNLYPQKGLQELLTQYPEKIPMIWAFLKSISYETLIENGRVYGGGMHKLEPKELGNIPADELIEIISM